MEIGGIEKMLPTGICPDRQAFVDSIRRWIANLDCLSRRRGGRWWHTRIPSRYRAVFGDKNKETWTRAATARHDKLIRNCVKRVKHLPGGGTGCRWNRDHQRLRGA